MFRKTFDEKHVDDEKAIRGIKRKPMYLAKQFIQLRTNWYSLETGLSEKKGGLPNIFTNETS